MSAHTEDRPRVAPPVSPGRAWTGLLLMVWPIEDGRYWTHHYLQLPRAVCEADPDGHIKTARQIGVEWVAREHQREVEGRPPHVPFNLSPKLARQWAARFTAPYRRRYVEIHLPWARTHGLYVEATLTDPRELARGLRALFQGLPDLAALVGPASPEGDDR